MKFNIFDNGYLKPIFADYPTFEHLGMVMPEWPLLNGAKAFVYRANGGPIAVTVKAEKIEGHMDFNVQVYPEGMPEWPVSLHNFRMIDIDDEALAKIDNTSTLARLYNDKADGGSQQPYVRVNAFSTALALALNNMVVEGVKGKIAASSYSWFLLRSRYDQFAVFDWSTSGLPRVIPVTRVVDLDKDFEEIEPLGEMGRFYIAKSGGQVDAGQLHIDYIAARTY